mgnify:CR=1 FL=1
MSTPTPAPVPARPVLSWHRRLEARVAAALGLLVAVALGAVIAATVGVLSAQSRERVAGDPVHVADAVRRQLRDRSVGELAHGDHIELSYQAQQRERGKLVLLVEQDQPQHAPKIDREMKRYFGSDLSYELRFGQTLDRAGGKLRDFITTLD